MSEINNCKRSPFPFVLFHCWGDVTAAVGEHSERVIQEGSFRLPSSYLGLDVCGPLRHYSSCCLRNAHSCHGETPEPLNGQG